MSYILDALKKIEHDKNKKATPAGRINISGDLFNERKSPSARTAVWKIAALIAVASLVTSAGTWLVLRGGGKKRTHAVTRPMASPRPAPVSPPAVSAVPAPPPAHFPSAPAAAVPPTPIVAAPVTPKSREKTDEGDSSSQEVRRLKKASPPASSKPVVQTVQPPADIKLSGIAWQDEHAARRAVINGFLLKEGAVVSGAKITDIRADRVRFSTAAGQFEIKLDSVVPAEAPK